MSENTKIKTKILQRIDTETNWETQNPVLSVGEIVFVRTDIGTFMKVGNGASYENTPFYPNVKIDGDITSAFNIVRISLEDYEQLVVDEQVDINTLYQISSVYRETFGEQIKNVAWGTDRSDAVTYSQLTSSIKSVQDSVDELDTPVHYGTCVTASSTATKIVECSTLTELKAGQTIFVKFSQTNTSTSPYLNVNQTGAKRAYRYGTTNPVTYTWYANQIVSFTYDGTYWLFNYPGPATTTYDGTVKLVTSGVTAVGTTGAATNSSIYNTLTAQIYPTAFSSSKQYKENDVVLYGGQIYRCTADYVGAWSTSYFTRLTLGNIINLLNGQISQVQRDYVSKSALSAAIASLNSSSTVAQLIQALQSLY